MLIELGLLLLSTTVVRSFASSNTGKKVFGSIAYKIDEFFGNEGSERQLYVNNTRNRLLPSDYDFYKRMDNVIEVEYKEIDTIEKVEDTDHYKKGKEYCDNGQLEKATEEFKLHLLIAPKHISSYIQIVMCYHSLGDVDNAIAYLEKALSIKSDISNGQSLLGKLYCEKGNPIKAIEYLKIGIQEKSTAAAYYELAKAYFLKGNSIDDVLKYCDKSLEMDNTYFEALVLKSTVFIEDGQLDNSIELLKSAMENNNLTKDIKYSLIIALCSVYSIKGEYELVIKECEKAVKIDENQPLAYIYRVFCHIAKGEFDKADDIINKLQVENEMIYICKGYINIGKGKLADGIECLNQALKLNDKNAETYNALYIVHNLLGNEGKAQQCMEKALRYKAKGQNFLPLKGVKIKDAPVSYADKYKILKYRYTGGTKFVLHTAESEDGTKVAIKELNDYFASQQLFVNLFKKEIDITRNIKHKNIIEVIENGINRYNDRYYIIMPLMKQNLADYIQRVTIDENEIINISLQILEGLKYLHQNNIIHRELKPTEILFDYDSTVKISDFANAKVSATYTSMSGASTNVEYSDAEYFTANERLMGKKVDIRADLYSVGALMYYMSVGKPPFFYDGVEENIKRRIRIIKDKLPCPSEFNPIISDKLNNIIMKAMERDRENRYQTDDDMINDLMGHGDVEHGDDSREQENRPCVPSLKYIKKEDDFNERKY